VDPDPDPVRNRNFSGKFIPDPDPGSSRSEMNAKLRKFTISQRNAQIKKIILKKNSLKKLKKNGLSLYLVVVSGIKCEFAAQRS
jgi:hypothetical protein